MERQSALTIDRRRLLKLLGSGSLAAASSSVLLPGLARAAGLYRVGVGHLPDPYDAALRAIGFAGDFPDVLGKQVFIKPNLLKGKTPESGTTTDPQVVRAIVDVALASGAAQITIIEAGPMSHFVSAGYDIFTGYDPRVTVDVTHDWVQVLTPVPGGRTYKELILPERVIDPDIVFISAAKLKLHRQGRVTLTMKNLFGIPPVPPYIDETLPEQNGRYGMHSRSVPQTVIDLNLTRPVHYAVIDGIIGMEGRGPGNGDPVRMDVVLAGANALAVDRVGAEVMGMEPNLILQFSLATQAGLGPAGLSEVDLVGDALPTRRFARPNWMPMVAIASAPNVFDHGGGNVAPIRFGLDERRPVQVGIATIYDDRPWDFTHVARVFPRAWLDRGWHDVSWDGRDDAGTLVAPGTYAIRVMVDDETSPRDSCAFRWIDVV